MDKKTEKRIEAKVGKKLGKEIQKQVEKEVEKEVRQKVDKEVKEQVDKEVEKVKKEVEKGLRIKIYERARGSAIAFKEEFKNQMVVAITAAFAFLIALSWRTPIQNGIDKLIVNLGLTGSAIYLEFLSALIITFLGVLALMWVSKWKSER